jgi:MATE family multidrug resistance protein
VLAIAVPVMISNVSTPLIGVVDTAIVGHYPNPIYIGAVAVGSLIFTFVFWGFGFLRWARGMMPSWQRGWGARC